MRGYYAVVCRSWLLAIVLLGCPEKIGTLPPGEDASAPADSAADAGFDVGPGDVDVADDAGSADADVPADSGVEDAAPPKAPLRFGMMQIQSGQQPPATIWGRSPSEMYAGTFNGNVLAYTGGAEWGVAWHEPNNDSIVRIRGTVNKIFVASYRTLWVHDAALGDAPRQYFVSRAVYDLHVVSDTEAYLVGDILNGRAVFGFDGSQVTELNRDLDVATLYGTYVDPRDGTLFVTGNGKIFRRSGATWFEETIDWPSAWTVATIANFDIYEIARVGERLFAVGDEQGVLEYEEADGRWRFAFQPPGRSEPLQAIGALSGGEAYAVGRRDDGGPIVRFSENAFLHSNYGDNHNLFDMWVASPDEIYCAGAVGSTFTPIILQGIR